PHLIRIGVYPSLTAVTTHDISTLSLHDALPIYNDVWAVGQDFVAGARVILHWDGQIWSRVDSPPNVIGLNAVTALSPTNIWPSQDRKSTRLNSSHVKISYAVFCLKKQMRNSNSA